MQSYLGHYYVCLKASSCVCPSLYFSTNNVGTVSPVPGLCLSHCQCVYLWLNFAACLILSAFLSDTLLGCLSVCLSVCLFVCLCLSAWLSDLVFPVCLIVSLWLVGWLAGWLAGWLVGWLAGWLAGWFLVPSLLFLFHGPSLLTNQLRQTEGAHHTEGQHKSRHQFIKQLGREHAPHEQMIPLNKHQHSVDRQKQCLAEQANVAHLV